MDKKESTREQCVKILSGILTENKLDFTSSIVDERLENGFYNEDVNITYPKADNGKNEPYFIAQIGFIDDDKNTLFTGKFYVWGDTNITQGYESKIAKIVCQQYYREVKEHQEKVKVLKKNFKLIEDVYV